MSSPRKILRHFVRVNTAPEYGEPSVPVLINPLHVVEAYPARGRGAGSIIVLRGRPRLHVSESLTAVERRLCAALGESS
jgi:hypothetical protein